MTESIPVNKAHAPAPAPVHAENKIIDPDERERFEVKVVDATMRKVMMHATMALISFTAFVSVRMDKDVKDFMIMILTYSFGTLMISFIVDNWMWTVWEIAPQLLIFTMICRGLTVTRLSVNKCVGQSETLMCSDNAAVSLYLVYFLLLGGIGILMISTMKLGYWQYHRTGK